MSTMPPCPSCGGRLIDTQRIRPDEAWRYQEEAGTGFRKLDEGAMTARLCVDCGLVRFFVTDANIRNAIQSYERADALEQEGEPEQVAAATVDASEASAESVEYTAGLVVTQTLDACIIELPADRNQQAQAAYVFEMFFLLASALLLFVPAIIYYILKPKPPRRRLILGLRRLRLQELREDVWVEISSIELGSIVSMERITPEIPVRFELGSDPVVFDLRFRTPQGWMDMRKLWLRGHELEWLEEQLRERLPHPDRAVEEDTTVPAALQAMQQRAADR